MGTIISTKKGYSQKSRVEQKTAAIGAFANSKSQQIVQSQSQNQNDKERKSHSKESCRQDEIRTGSQASMAVASWGEGVVGTRTHPLQGTGTVSSRGVDGEVVSSKQLYPNIKSEPANNTQLYTGFAQVTPVSSRQLKTRSEAATTIQSMYRGYKTRKSLDQEKMAAINIQRYVRGYQARQELQKQELSAKAIQRRYRNYLKTKSNTDPGEVHESLKEDDSSDDDEEEEGDEEGLSGQENRKEVKYNRPWNEPVVAAPVLDNEVKIGKKTKESFEMYQEDITDLKWKTEQQIEATTMGSDFVPPRIVLISSNISRSDVLEKIVRDDTLKILYDFKETALDALAVKVAQTLENHKRHCKALSMALVCQGAPGYFNPVRGKIITPVSLKTDEEILRFWKTLGQFMTKINPENTKIHLIGNNMAGNKQGVKLLKLLKKACKPSIVTFECPLELSKEGVEMLASYFDYEKYKIWKTRMHSKVSFKL